MERFVIELFVRGGVLCLLAAMTLFLLRHAAAAYRHQICVLALCALLILPLAQRLMPPLRLQTERVNVSTEEASRLSGRKAKSEMSPSLEMPQHRMVPPKSATFIPSNSAPLPRKVVQERSGHVPAILFAVWGLGTVTLLIRLMVALYGLRRLEAESRKTMLGSVPILVSEQVRTPLTWGIRRSVILLPAALLSGDRAVCVSALRHEQAHVARWDWMWNLLAELVCAFCWFQPGAWWLRSRMRLESERACDDRVLLSGVAGLDYAAHLVQILRSVGSNEVAPAMAQGRGMEARMRHILDAARPRHASTTWLAVSAPFALALLSLAALRVAARSVEAKLLEAKLQPGMGAAIMDPKTNSNRSLARPSKPADPAEKPAATDQADASKVKGSPTATPDHASPAVRLENVTWGKAVDGLQPGLLLTTPGLANNPRLPFNSHVDFLVLVRNVSARERFIEVRRGGSDPWNPTPYVIPNDELRDALRARVLPQRFQAVGVLELSEIVPAYDVKLAAGETVVVPQTWPFGARGLYLGDADKESFPRMETIKAGMNWIVQPITIRLLNAAEQAQAESMMQPSSSMRTVVTTIDHAGKTGQSPTALVGAQSGGKQLYAMIQLDIGPRDAAPGRNHDGGQAPTSSEDASSQTPAAPATVPHGNASRSVAAPPQEPAGIVWGPGREVQAGLALTSRYGSADQHTGLYVFGVYLRNRTSHTLNINCQSYDGLTVPGDNTEYETLIQSNLVYCTPHLLDSNGKPVDVAFKLGADNIQYSLGPGQVVLVSHWMLRTMDRTKGSTRAKYTLVALVEPGKYRMSCDVSASWGGGRRVILRTGETAFDVTRADVAAE
jgi:beta-lactamase regulating signal transducer with metallopeptidase domain